SAPPSVIRVASQRPVSCSSLSGYASPCTETCSKLDHDLECLAFVHRAVAVGDLVEADDPVEDAARIDAAFEDIRQQLLDVGAHRRGAAAHADVVVEGRLRGRHGLVLGDANAADRATRTRDLDRGELRLLE